MAVNIDSLQIEIEATSIEAAKRVQNLADALTNLKAAAKGGAGLTTVSKQLQALASAAASLNNTGIGKLKELAPALNSLSSIQKSSGLNSTINALKKLPEVSASLKEADLVEFATQMNQVASAVRPLATEMQKVSNGFAAFPIRIQKIIQSNAGLAASNNKTAKSFGVLGSGISSVQAKFGIYSVVFQQIAKIASSWVKESNDYVENLNLFTVAMGDAAESALEYAETVRDAVGIDPSEWIRNQGVFKQITSGFGVMEEKANLMSQNLTQLGYDISSFYNISIEEAMEKLQSGIAGEIEPLRRLGYAIDVATLQQVAYEHGIQQSVNTMNQAQKSQLRYIAIMEQSGNAMQDLARTSMTPSNALRILNQQITQLSRALGNLLIPLLQKIIPWVQAFVEVITDAIQALAVFFGFELPTIDYSGMDGIASGANNVEDAISGATGAAKEMKKALLGIDELTILEPTKTGGASGAGGIGNGDLGLELPEYDFLAGLKEQTDDLKTRMKDLLENYIIPIGTALAAWKILNLLSGLGTAASLVGNLKKALAGALTAYLEFRLVSGAAEDFLSDDGTIWDIVKDALYTAVGSGILYMVFGTGGLVVGLGVSLVANFIKLQAAIANDLDYNGFKSNLMTLLTSGLGAGVGAGIAALVGAAAPVGATLGFLLTAAVVLNMNSVTAHTSGQLTEGTGESFLAKLTGVLAAGLAGAGIGFTIGGPGGAAVGFIIGAGLSVVGQDIAIDFGTWYQETDRIINGIEVLDDTISETTQNVVGPFLDQMQNLSDILAGLEFTGQIIDDSIVVDTQSKLNAIVDSITSSLDANKNEALSALSPLEDILGPSKFAEIISANESYYSQMQEKLRAGESSISEILKAAAEENRAITENEWAQIHEIESSMQDLGISNLSQTQIEYETIMRNLRDNAAHLSLEQASEIIKNAQATRDETISAAETQYSTVLLEAQKMLDTGVINSEQYQAIVDAAKNAKDSTIADATEQYESIYDTASTKLGDLSRYIDENTGEIKSIWQVFWDDVGMKWNNFWDSIENGWQDFKTSFKSGWNEFWTTGLGGSVVSGINGIISTVEKGLNWVIEKINSLSFTTPDWLPLGLGGKHFGLDIPQITLGRVSMPTFALGGFPDHGEMFIAREQGPELVGRIGNRTAVANNDQIVSGIATANEGVINAIIAATQQIISSIENNGGDVYMDGDKVGERVTAYQNRQNRMYGKTLQRV